jgi:hypothetical protein
MSVSCYVAEAGGYLSVSVADAVEVLAGPEEGEKGNDWVSYYYVHNLSTGMMGWAPAGIFQSNYAAGDAAVDFHHPLFPW